MDQRAWGRGGLLRYEVHLRWPFSVGDNPIKGEGAQFCRSIEPPRCPTNICPSHASLPGLHRHFFVGRLIEVKFDRL